MFQNLLYQSIYKNLLDNINNIINETQEPERQKIIEELEYTEGFFDDVGR